MSMRPTVYQVDEYEPQEFDCVLVQEGVAVCLRKDPRLARVIPLDKVNHVDGDPRMLLSGPEIPDSFYGGGICGYIDTSEYPEIEAHLAEIEREEY